MLIIQWNFFFPKKPADVNLNIYKESCGQIEVANISTESDHKWSWCWLQLASLLCICWAVFKFVSGCHFTSYIRQYLLSEAHSTNGILLVPQLHSPVPPNWSSFNKWYIILLCPGYSLVKMKNWESSGQQRQWWWRVVTQIHSAKPTK